MERGLREERVEYGVSVRSPQLTQELDTTYVYECEALMCHPLPRISKVGNQYSLHYYGRKLVDHQSLKCLNLFKPLYNNLDRGM